MDEAPQEGARGVGSSAGELPESCLRRAMVSSSALARVSDTGRHLGREENVRDLVHFEVLHLLPHAGSNEVP